MVLLSISELSLFVIVPNGIRAPQIVQILKYIFAFVSIQAA